MATAKRVKQDGKYERVQTVIERTCDINYRENGVIVKNYPVPSATERVESSQSRFVPQPDRIVLDLSIEEAMTLRIIGGLVGGFPDGRRGDTDAINKALENLGLPYHLGHNDLAPGGQGVRFRALRTPVSPTQGTSPSKAQDTASSAPNIGRYPSSIDR